MKRLLTLSLSVLLTIPAIAATKFASGSEAGMRRLPNEAGRFERRLAQARAAQRDGVGAQVLTDIRASGLLIFPAAGNVRGANGEFFRSDVTLISRDPSDHQHLAVVWLANGVNTDTPPEVELTLEPNVYYTFADFVGTVLGITNQLGSIVILPVDDAGDFDLEAAIDGFSRIWTNQPNAAGTVAQPFEPVDPFGLAAEDTVSIMGLRHDAQYRSNFGIVNLDESEHTFAVRFIGQNANATDQVTLPAGTMIHRAIPAGTYGPLAIEVRVDDPNAIWTAYGTSNDNITGDGWVSIGSFVTTPGPLFK